jgi:hypothetical protein
MGPGGSGLPGALGACAVARTTDAKRKIAVYIFCDKQDSSRLSSQFSKVGLILIGRRYYFS